MAAGTWTLYNNARSKIVDGTISLASSVLRCKLYKAAASASVSVSTLSLLSQIGTTNETANTSDYTLSGVDITAIAGSATHKFTANNLVISASGGVASVQYALVYMDNTANSHVLMWCKLSTAAFTVADTNTLTINTPTNGFFVIY
jgi:hypothetical protein